jgi:hypothetical protein
MLLICLEDMKVLSGIAITIYQGTVKGKIDLENREMIVVLDDTLNRKDLLCVSSSSDCRGPPSYSSFVFVFGINLPQPSAVPVARRADEQIGMDIFKKEILFLILCRDYHVLL